MKLWLGNIQKFLICIAFLSNAIILHAEEIDPTDVSYVSINPYTNEVSVCWYKSESANIGFARILYIYDETTLIKGKGIVDVPGNEDNTYLFKTDSISLISYEANEKPMSLAVDAYSENGNNSTSLREYHTTMVASARVTRCPSQIQISWTPYFGYGITIDKYEIIESSNGTEISVKECLGTTTSCIVDLNEEKERSFFVRAVFNDCRGTKRTSTSSMCFVSEKTSTLPQFIAAENISIESNNDISLRFKYDVTSDYRNYIIYKSEFDTNHFVGIDTINLYSNSSEYYSLIDTLAYKKDTAVYYKSAVFDNCGTKILETPTISPIKLKSVQELDELTNMIEWSSNTPWTDEYEYNILRTINNETEQIEATVESNTHEYIDDLTDNFKRNFSQCYRIEARSQSYSSFSNSVCLNKEYKLLIPNAFNPFSNITENTTFKPKFAFLTGEYTMKIFDRFGTCIFTSNDINVGWDGLHKGKNVPTGMYNYQINIVLPNGENIERHGTVQLIYK